MQMQGQRTIKMFVRCCFLLMRKILLNFPSGWSRRAVRIKRDSRQTRKVRKMSRRLFGQIFMWNARAHIGILRLILSIIKQSIAARLYVLFTCHSSVISDSCSWSGPASDGKSGQSQAANSSPDIGNNIIHRPRKNFCSIPMIDVRYPQLK